MKEFLTKNSMQTQMVGMALGKKLSANDVVLLEGDLSAGKTTFTKGVGQALGIKRVINSPTFTIVKSYSGDFLKLHHMDLYRLDGLGNDFDLYEYFEDGGVCIVEWPHQVDQILPDEYILVRIIHQGEDNRLIQIQGIGNKYEQLVGDLECIL